MKEGKASVKRDRIAPGMALATDKPVRCSSTSYRSWVVNLYVIEPAAGRKDYGLEMLVRNIWSKLPAGII